MKFDKKRFAANLRAERARMRFSQADVEKYTGIYSSSISSYENAERVPSVENAHKLAVLYGTTVTALITD